MAQAPISYKDPAWDAAEAAAAKRTGVPQEVLAAIRTQGEKSNGDQISPKGAKGVYQFTPKTERLFFEKYGVSAYSNDPVEQATAAAYHLKESYARTKDWGLAAAGYNGGLAGEKNPRFTKETSDYYDRVTAALPEGIRTRIPGLGKPQQALARNEESGVPLAQPVSWEDAWAGRAPDFAVVSDDSGATGRAPATVGTTAAFAPNFPVEASPLVPLAQATQAAQEAKEAKRQEQKRWGRNDRNTTMGAALSMALTPTANAIAHVYAMGELRDEAYIARRKADPLAVYSYVENPTQDEKDLLASTQSETDLALALTKINTEREDRGVMANVSGTEQFLMGTLGALADPVGWAAGFGAMKGFQMAGIGATALMAAGRPVAAGASLMAENALGNVLSEAGLQALGEHRSVDDYAMSALAGAALSVPFLPSTVRAAHNSAVLKAAQEAYNRQAPFFKQASDELGAAATPETIRERAAVLEAEAHAAEAQKRLAAPGPSRKIDAPDTETMLAREVDQPGASDMAAADSAKAAGGAKVAPAYDDPAFIQRREDAMAVNPEWRAGFSKVLDNELDIDSARALPVGVTVTRAAQAVPQFKQAIKAVEELSAELMPNKRIVIGTGMLGEGDGVVVSTKDVHAIGLSPKLSQGSALHTALHELGHTVYHEHARNVPPATLAKVDAEWGQFVAALKRGDMDEAINRRFSATSPSRNAKSLDKENAYHLSRDEYIAEQFVKWVQDKGEAGLGVSKGTLATIINALKDLVQYVLAAGRKGYIKPGEGTAEMFEWVLKNAKEQGAKAEEFLAPDLRMPDLGAENVSPAQPKVLDAIDAKYGTDTIDTSDVAGRMRQKYIKKLRADAEAWLAANPQDPERLKTLMDNRLFDFSTPGHVLAASDDPLAKMYAALVVEDAMGAGGRHDTASIRKFMISQSLIGSSVIDYDRELTAWATGQRGWARSVADSLTKGELQDKFNKAVFTEIENRLHQRPSTQDGNVLRAADSVQSAMERMRLAQVDNKTAGWGALPTTSVGYLPHRFNAAALMALEPEAQRALVDILRGQLIDLNGFDEAFADRIAKVYVQHARTNANAGHEIPGNMHDPAAAHYVEEAMRAQGMTRDEIQQYANKLRAGAMSHTKKRLKLDLSAEYAPGKQLMELYHTDIPSLLKGQAERVGGEVALTQSGIMGSAGLKMIEDALSFKPAGMTAEAHKKMMEAFQQTAAEMLDRPWRNESGQVQWANRAMQANTLSSLGGMGFAQLQEGVNIGLTLGVGHAMRSLASVPQLIGEIKRMARGEKVENSVLHSMEQFGGGGEFGMADYKMILKLDDPSKVHTAVGQDGINMLDRGLRLGARALRVISFHRMTTAVQVRSAALEITSKALRYIKEGTDDKALADMGFTPEVRAAIKADIDKAVVWNGNSVKSFDITKITNTEAASAFVTAVHRGSRQIIQGSFVGEKHRWQHTMLGRMATQFRTFPLVAMEKQLGRNRATYGAAAVLGMVLAALPFVMVIQAGRVLLGAVGREDSDKYIDERMSPEALTRASLNYLGILGLIPDVVNGLTTMLPDEVDQALGGAAGGRHGQKGLSAVVPIVGWGDKVVRAATNEGAKKVSPLLSVTPLNNTPLLAPLTNLLRDSAQ
jgi:hypothetical protein